MKVVIIARTTDTTAALTFDGTPLTLHLPEPDPACRPGDVIELTRKTEAGRATLHVQEWRPLAPLGDLVAFIERHAAPHAGSPEALFASADSQPAARFWRPDRPLRREESADGVQYRYDERTTFLYRSVQPPPPQIAAGTLVRIVPDTQRRAAALTGWYQAAAAVDEWDFPEQSPLDGLAFPDGPETGEPANEEGESLPVLPPFPPDITPRRLLKQVFGYDDFRPLQDQVIATALAGRDTLTIMPTGSGKSLCFQLPALLWPGLTVVVSPLISLMQDQVVQLRQAGVPAVTLNSALPFPVYHQVVSDIRAGRAKLLYVAPETLLRSDILQLLGEITVSCLTIDEAHCISEWGHDFRPEYRQLIQARQRMPQAVCMAVTATATEQVRDDIKRALNIPDAGTFIASFNRDNLHLAVEPKQDGVAQVMRFLERHRGEAGIIYCTTRRQTDQLAEQLALHGWPVLPYHAGLDDGTRARNQRRFIHEEGVVMVATIAFGMGINKSNVRFVLHYDLPKNLEGYYQQIGRSGRDGLPADCLLLFSYKDVQTINFFIQQEDAARQAGSRQRLDAMVSFVESAVCRRKPLLAWFGEVYEAESCELCDNCLAEAQESADLTTPAQKFLSCVKRTGELFGMSHIVDVLRGSRSKKVLDRGHDRLSTYNIGGEFSKQGWQHLARQFLQQQLLAQDLNHGSLKLTVAGWEVLKGQRKVAGILPQQEQAQGQALAQRQADYDAALFARLRDRRTALATAAGVPPYVIFSDRSLVEMATFFPQSAATFANLYGVGQSKLEKYAAEFLPIIRDYCAENGIEERNRPISPTTTPSQRIAAAANGKGRMEEVVERFNSGQSVPELAAIYTVKIGTITGHLYNGHKAGIPLRQAPELLEAVTCSPELCQRALATFEELGPDFLRPVLDALEGQVSYDDLHILRLWFLIRPG
jgi:ATP-dependent DNA helicase RecQ